MGVISWGRSAVRWVLGAAVCAWIVVGWYSVAGDARQTRSVATGLYSAAQAARAQALYKEQCASCHGEAMEGTIGPPMAGDVFLTAWSGRPVAELVDKIHKTMPFNLPGSLSRQQAIDLAAYILQVDKFPAGQAELADAQLAQVTFPTRAAAAAPVAAAAGGTTALVPPVGNLAELMRAIAFPSANIIFQLQVKDPTGEKPGPAPVPFDYVKWGATIYPGWLAVDQAALALAGTFLTVGKCKFFLLPSLFSAQNGVSQKPSTNPSTRPIGQAFHECTKMAPFIRGFVIPFVDDSSLFAKTLRHYHSILILLLATAVSTSSQRPSPPGVIAYDGISPRSTNQRLVPTSPRISWTGSSRPSSSCTTSPPSGTSLEP